ncbi:MAG: hypothetical protein EXR72_04535 [Myxococcales bacterium]|nr:hypothetical protein [Myxococcales bacterium]
MTEDVDILSTHAARLAEDLRAHLGRKFHIATRVREVEGGGFRIYQVRKPKNRHLVDVRQIETLPEHRHVDGVPVLVPLELAAMKVMSLVARKGQAKGDTDRADLRRLLLASPDLQERDGPVAERLRALGADAAAFAAWREILAEKILPDSDDY